MRAEKQILDFLNRYKRENYIGVYSCQMLNKRENNNEVLWAHGKYTFSKNGNEKSESFELKL